jgi:hypothetical protein
LPPDVGMPVKPVASFGLPPGFRTRRTMWLHYRHYHRYVSHNLSSHIFVVFNLMRLFYAAYMNYSFDTVTKWTTRLCWSRLSAWNAGWMWTVNWWFKLRIIWEVRQNAVACLRDSLRELPSNRRYLTLRDPKWWPSCLFECTMPWTFRNTCKIWWALPVLRNT